MRLIYTTIRPIFLACCTTLLVAGCQPIPSPIPFLTTPAVETMEQGDHLAVSTQEGGVRIDVYSERGIGAAQVRFPSSLFESTNAEPIVVAFHLQGLEQAVFDNGEQRLELSVSSHDPFVVAQSLFTREGVQSLTEADALWARIEIIAENGELATIPLHQGRIEVTLPAGFLNAHHPVLSLRWIDFYR